MMLIYQNNLRPLTRAPYAKFENPEDNWGNPLFFSAMEAGASGGGVVLMLVLVLMLMLVEI